MKLDELRFFFEVCRCNSFNQAAKNLYISRQSLVRSITNLENSLNMQLFSRGYTGVNLTDFGQMFYDQADPAVRLLEDLQELPRAYLKQHDRHVTIGIRGSFRSAFAVRRLLEDFSRDCPGIDVEIVDCSDGEICSFVEEERLDFGFTLLPEELPENVGGIEFIDMEQKLLIRKDHRLAAADAISPDMLLGEKIMIAAYSDHPYQLLRKFTERSYEPEVLFATVDMGLVFHVIRTENIAGMLLDRDAEIGARLYDNLVIRSFAPPVVLKMGLLYQNSGKLSAQKRMLLNYFREHFHEKLSYS